MYPTGVTLGDLGERELVLTLLASRYRPINASFGNDVAEFGTFGGGVLVATTDPAPQPAAWEWFEPDYFDWGWLLGALNLSDLAAAGAQPLGLLTSFTLPSETLVKDFMRLLDGVDAVCKANGTMVRGGNLKESRMAVCEATALGTVTSRPHSRSGAEPGDVLYAVGEVGLFWSALLHAEETGREPDEVRDALCRPWPQIALGQALNSSGLVKACTDASDGLYAALCGLTADQGLGFVLQSSEVRLSARAERLAVDLNIEHIRLALGFGNLELVCAISPDREERFLDLVRKFRTHVTPLGAVDGERDVRVMHNGSLGILGNFDNERFSHESQFTSGLAAYRDRLLGRPLSDSWA